MYQHSMSSQQFSAPAVRRCARLPVLRAIASQRRREHLWAWASALLLLLCWDASLRMDEKVPLPRVRLAHAVDMEAGQRGRTEDLDVASR